MSAQTEIPKRLCYPVIETSTLLGISTRSTWRAIREGDLAATRIGSRILVPAHAIETFIAERTDKSGARVREVPRSIIEHHRAQAAARKAQG